MQQQYQYVTGSSIKSTQSKRKTTLLIAVAVLLTAVLAGIGVWQFGNSNGATITVEPSDEDDIRRHPETFALAVINGEEVSADLYSSALTPEYQAFTSVTELNEQLLSYYLPLELSGVALVEYVDEDTKDFARVVVQGVVEQSGYETEFTMARQDDSSWKIAYIDYRQGEVI